MKHLLDMTVASVEKLGGSHVLIRLTHAETLPPALPGQFVSVRVDGSSATFLRRPFSINFIDREANELSLLVAVVGNGTRRLSLLRAGDSLNCLLPLGNGFTVPREAGARHLLVGGGVGAAPLLYLGKTIRDNGGEPVFLIGAKSSGGLLQLERLGRYGRVLVTTEDGTAGFRGYVTDHPALREERFDFISACGPRPMMASVARYARESGTACEVSLENSMACGVGACLCCVEDTVRGNVCVCKEGPVFNINDLKWQI